VTGKTGIENTGISLFGLWYTNRYASEDTTYTVLLRDMGSINYSNLIKVV
jgi:hypothetical protein